VRPVLGHAAALLLGGAVAVASLAVHRDLLGGVPAGLVLVAATSVYVAWVLRRFTATGRPAASYCLGWLLVLTYVLVGRPEGDFVIAADLEGYALIGVGLVLVVLLVSSLVGRGAARGHT
jgi:hypothetical protein